MKNILHKICLTLVLCLLLSQPLMATAADTSVTYNGSKNGFTVTNDDLFDNFKNLMPGDSVSQNIEVINGATDSSYIKVYLQAVAPDPEDVEMVGFLEQLTMTVYADEVEIFDDAPSQTGDLDEMTYLYKLSKGESQNLEVCLEIPLSLSNEFAQSMASVTWTFHVAAFSSSSSSTTIEIPEDIVETDIPEELDIEETPEEPLTPVSIEEGDDTEISEIIPRIIPEEVEIEIEIEIEELIDTGQEKIWIYALAAVGICLISTGFFLIIYKPKKRRSDNAN